MRTDLDVLGDFLSLDFFELLQMVECVARGGYRIEVGTDEEVGADVRVTVWWEDRDEDGGEPAVYWANTLTTAITNAATHAFELYHSRVMDSIRTDRKS